MCEHEYRMVKGRVFAPPTFPWFLRMPGARMPSKHVATHNCSAHVGECGLQNLVAGIYLATFKAVHFAEERKRKRPFVQAIAADTQGVVNALLRPGNEAIERQRYL